MKERKTKLMGLFIVMAMALLIIDGQTAFYGASEGIKLCIYSVVPSLFPFIFLSTLLTTNARQGNPTLIKHLCKTCGIDAGCASILVSALLGGYPVGAQAIHTAWKNGKLTTQSARRLLSFCNNAGPSFIFGILGTLFTMRAAPLLLWLIQILTALIVGVLLKENDPSIESPVKSQKVSSAEALNTALKAIALISGWVIIFRIGLTFLHKYVLYALPQTASVLISGILELTNGCYLLANVPNEALRFIVASVLLSCGGLCVLLQTKAVTGSLGIGKYFPGKVLQTCLSFIFSAIAAALLYP